MKILLITSNLEGGGAQKAMLNLASGLASRGHETCFLVFKGDGAYAVEGNKFQSLLGPTDPLHGGWFGKRVLALRLRRWHRRVTERSPFHLTISTLPLADEVTRLAGLPNVWFRIANTLSQEIAHLSDARKSRRRLARYRSLYEGQNIIAVSEGVSNDLRQNLRLEQARIETIYNPFDFAEIRRLAHLADRDIPNEPYVLHVGRFARQKRHDLVLDAFQASAIPHRLVLLADSEPGLVSLIESRGLGSRVSVVGFKPNPYPWYAKASAVMLASDHEGMPNVLVEALACGVPVVSTDCPSGPREVLTGAMSRYLVPCGDVSALSARLRDIVNSPPTLDAASLAKFDKDRILSRIESLASIG